VRVHGINLSKAMVARLRAKPGGEDIGVTIGDFATTSVDGADGLDEVYGDCGEICTLGLSAKRSLV